MKYTTSSFSATPNDKHYYSSTKTRTKLNSDYMKLKIWINFCYEWKQQEKSSADTRQTAECSADTKEFFSSSYEFTEGSQIVAAG